MNYFGEIEKSINCSSAIDRICDYLIETPDADKVNAATAISIINSLAFISTTKRVRELASIALKSISEALEYSQYNSDSLMRAEAKITEIYVKYREE